MFFHPWFLAMGLAAVGVPLAVHWLTKPKPVRMPLSTLRFVREAIHERRARHRLRDFIVLALRTFAIVCLAFAIARPRFGEQPLVSASQQGSAIRVVLVDVSQSMAAVNRNATAIERARTMAATHLRYRPGLRANLILAGAQPRAVFSHPSQNFEALREELHKTQVRPERLNINNAIRAAAEMLAAGSGSDRESIRREFVVISDFQRSNWARADFSALPQEAQIQLMSTSDGSTAANLAILRAEIKGRVTANSPVQLEVDVGNYSPVQRDLTVEVPLGDSIFRLSGKCPASRRTTLTQEIQLPQTGWHLGQARLVGIDDALSADDERGIAVHVSGSPTFVLLTRQTANQIPSSSYFLERALVPRSDPGDRPSVDLVRMNPGNIDREKLANADLIIVDHPGKIDANSLQLLAGLMRRGRPLLYLASEPIDATNLRAFGEAAGAGLQLPVTFHPPMQKDARRNLTLASVQKDDAPFDVLGENSSAILGRIQFAGGLSSRRQENTLDEDILATYSDGSACLVLTSSELGRLAVFNADLSNSTLPIGEAFVPIIDRLILRLLQPPRSQEQALAGEPLVVRLPSNVGSANELGVVRPEASQSAHADALGELLEEGAGVVWRWPSPDMPGVYRVERSSETVFAMPIHLAEEESQLESLSADVLKNRLAGGLNVHYRAASSAADDKDVAWTWILVACVGGMIAEFVALICFRS